ELGWFGFTAAMLFIGVLVLGFVYDWKKGALEWE
ncbi:MAG: NADH-quinone oxidoreductase subunit A, partial [SAR324 cluster bacterium]|nr:NADH-quinone oxidoreductase subunit A [SAR324 cluster bacterium]